MFVFPSRRVMRKRSGRSNTSAAKTVARSENCRARAFRSLLLGMLFRRLCGRDRTFCEWQSAGVLRLLHARGAIFSSATARLYIRRVAERRRSVRCCCGCCSDACADTPARSANGSARSAPAFCMPEVRFLCQRRHVCTYGEWQSAGVPSAAVGACGSDACAGRVRTVRERRDSPLRRIWSYSQPATRLCSAEA